MVETVQGLIRAGNPIVAPNPSVVDLVALHSKTSRYRTYAIGFAIIDGALLDTPSWDRKSITKCALGAAITA